MLQLKEMQKKEKQTDRILQESYRCNETLQRNFIKYPTVQCKQL